MKLPKGVIMRFGINKEAMEGFIVLLAFSIFVIIYNGVWIPMIMFGGLIFALIFGKYLEYFFKKDRYIVTHKKFKVTPKHWYIDFYGTHK